MSTDGLVDIGLEDKKGTTRMIISNHAKYINEELLANQLTAEM